ncbi:MAG: hypothetical protein GX918_09190 [Clostridiales bacterium]|nr:hypothetical protein [Clostridiales bacterium]
MKDIEREKCRRRYPSLGVLPGYPVNSRITVTVTGGALPQVRPAQTVGLCGYDICRRL